MRFSILSAALLVLALPLAKAEAFTVTTNVPVALDGELVVETKFPQGRMDAESLHGVVELRGATGIVRVYSWETPSWSPAGLGITSLPAPMAPDEWELRNGTIRILVEGSFTIAFKGLDDATARISGNVRDAALPVFMTTNSPPPPPAELDDSAGRVRWAWNAGDAFFGNWNGSAAPMKGEPDFTQSALSLAGRFTAHVFGGTADFVDANGESHVIRLGAERLASPVEGGPRLERWTRLAYEGSFEETHIPLAESWAVAAPIATWTLDGAIHWRDAHGTMTHNDQTIPLDGARIAGAGVIRMTPSQTLLGSTFDGDGDWSMLSIDGALLAGGETPAPLARAAEVSLWAAIVAFVLLLASHLSLRGVGAYYTRFAPADLVVHPTRAAMLQEVRAQPGIHARALMRAVGATWGPFTFHLRLLVRAGHLRTRREGRYLAIFGSGSRVEPEFVVRSATARRVFDAIPEDGSPIQLATLREGTALSRQLLDHHVKSLGEQGLVVRDVAPGGSFVRRARSR